jgi:hypothetical protein
MLLLDSSACKSGVRFSTEEWLVLIDISVHLIILAHEHEVAYVNIHLYSQQNLGERFLGPEDLNTVQRSKLEAGRGRCVSDLVRLAISVLFGRISTAPMSVLHSP